MDFVIQIQFRDVLWTLVLGLILWICLRKYLRWKRWAAIIDLIPGPPRIPILGNALQIVANRKEVVKRITGRFNTYGPMFRMWFGFTPTIAFSKAEHIEILLNSSKHIEKSYFYRFLIPWLGDGLLLSKGAKWHAHRKLITPAFHFKILEAFHDIFKVKSDILVSKLEKYAKSKEPFDIYSFISHATLDVICETAMGTNMNAQGDKQSNYVKSIYEISEVIAHRSRRLWLYPNFIFSLTNKHSIYNNCLEVLHTFTKKVIKERKNYRKSMKREDPVKPDEWIEGEKKRIAFLDILLEAADNGANLDETSIREEVDTFMFEGHDTTATGISWTLFLLGHHPECQERIFQELDDIFHGDDRPITSEDVNEMKYLERVIKESMRIYPPVPIIGRILEEDVEIDGYKIPAGVSIGIFIHILHRDPRFFPDPERFDPDRFLIENVKEKHPFAYIPFSAGSRNCIGQKFAILEEKVLLASVLRKYKIRSIDKREDLHILYELVLRASDGFRIVLEKRF